MTLETSNYVLLWVSLTAIGVPVFVVIVYVCARAASVGWYKSKLEHFREVLKITGDKDG